MTPAAAIAASGLLGAFFAGESWDRWRAVLKAAYTEPLSPEEDALFREVADRDPPTAPVSELWAIAGRRAGKDSVASALATVTALGDYGKHLRPGERATVLCIAATRDQAGIVFRYIRGYFDTVPLLRALVARATDDTLELTNGAEIIVSTNNFRVVRGRSVVAAIFDEAAYYRSDESASPDSELYNAVLPAMATFPNAILIGISSPYRRQGLLYEKWTASYGRPDPDVLVVRGASRVFNPSLRQKIVDDRMARDPEAGAAEYLAEWRNDLSDFLDRELVESAVDNGVPVRPPHPRIDYRMAIDSAGGRGDSFAAALAHAEGETVVLDALIERRAPFNPTQVVSEVADLARDYGITRATGDRYAAGWVTEAFAKEGIAYQNSERDRSAIYLDALPIFTAGRARLLDSPRLVNQFVSLERRTGRTGRDTVNHPANGADDLANAAALALVLAEADRRPVLVRANDLLDGAGRPLPIPTRVESVYAIIAANRAGQCAIVYAAIALGNVALPDQTFGRPTYILDFDAGTIWPRMFADACARAIEFAHATNAITDHLGNRAVFLWTDPRLARQAEVANVAAWPIPDHLIASADESFLSASMHIRRGLVKVCEPAHERAKSSPFGGALDFRGGDSADDPLRQAALWAIALSLDGQQ